MFEFKDVQHRLINRQSMVFYLLFCNQIYSKISNKLNQRNIPLQEIKKELIKIRSCKKRQKSMVYHYFINQIMKKYSCPCCKWITIDYELNSLFFLSFQRKGAKATPNSSYNQAQGPLLLKDMIAEYFSERVEKRQDYQCSFCLKSLNSRLRQDFINVASQYLIFVFARVEIIDQKEKSFQRARTFKGKYCKIYPLWCDLSDRIKMLYGHSLAIKLSINFILSFIKMAVEQMLTSLDDAPLKAQSIWLLNYFDLEFLQVMSTYFRAYSNLLEVRLDEIEPRRNEYEQYFTRHDQREVDEINTIITRNIFTPIETLLKHIHKRYHDAGLQYTLIHKLFSSIDAEISYYVPELVYIAIRKPCKPMKKLLIQRAKQNQSLRRLILWNVKAFTVLMKQKDPEIKKQIEMFQEELIKHVKNMTKFNHSMKAIAMLTQASLILKKMPTPNLKEKLQKFIRRYNADVLNNLEHGIVIPFRQEHHQILAGKEKHHFNSNYVVHIIEDDCSCFPTRKRVPYRIIIQTIDPVQLHELHPSQKFTLIDKVEPDDERDLYNEVSDSVEHLFAQAHFKIDPDTIYVKDNEQNKRISQMKNFVSKLEKEEIKEQQEIMTRSKLKARTTTMMNQYPHNKPSLSKYQIKPSEALKKFDSIYISGKTPSFRRSEMSFNDLNNLQNPDRSQAQRRSGGHIEKQTVKQIETYIEGEFKDWNLNSESIWGQAWELKKVKYSMKSNFSKFRSLRLRNVVVKGGDDLRQEIICMQLIYKMRDIIRDAGVDLLIKPYEIIVLSENSGLLEFVSNSISLDEMKKKSEGCNISKFFSDVFQTEEAIRKAKDNFLRSLAGSSILTYVLKLKDRHNGNILLDMEGNIIHIDFGFILGMAPGNLSFESSPFKFTAEYVDLFGGKESDNYTKFSALFCDGMMALRKRVEELTLILEIMMEESDLDCFKDFQIDDFKNSFKLHYSEDKYADYCKTLVERSCMNSRTVHYDTFQYYSNGIMP